MRLTSPKESNFESPNETEFEPVQLTFKTDPKPNITKDTD